MKKFKWGFIVMFILVESAFINNAYGAEESTGVIVSEENEERIDYLFELRGELAVDFAVNEQEIKNIDTELQELGVEFISEEEVNQKLGKEVLSKEVSPKNMLRATVLPTKGITWTSTRQITVYRGKEYELQIIRGVCNAADSPLTKTYISGSKKSSSTSAITTNILQILATSVTGTIPEFGGGVNVLKTFYDIYKTTINGLSTTSVIGEVTASYTTQVVSEEIFVFIKYSGALDIGNQIMGYMGNKVNYQTVISIPGIITVGGSSYANIETKKQSGTISSPYYSGGYIDKASNNFWEYKNGNSMFEYTFLINRITQKMIGGSVNLSVPICYVPLG